MGLLPQGVADVDPILRWFIELRLQLIEEAACGPQASGTGAPGMEEGRERISRSLGRDWKADEQAIVDQMRAEVRKWWQDFPERQLLTDLYKRAALRRAGCGTRYSRRRPCHSEGLRVASGLLADVPKPGRLDSEWESAAVSEVLAALLLQRSEGGVDAIREFQRSVLCGHLYAIATARAGNSSESESAYGYRGEMIRANATALYAHQQFIDGLDLDIS